jgi:hypothetical protein
MFERVILSVLVAVLVFCCFGMVMAYRQSSEFVPSCTEAGGVPIRAKSGLVCLDPSAFRQHGSSEGAPE